MPVEAMRPVQLGRDERRSMEKVASCRHGQGSLLVPMAVS